MTSPRPSLDLLRRLTDRHVFEQLLDHPELTRAELATGTGISKPTISESVKRLLNLGVLEESGRQQGKRGPAGTFCRLRNDLGVALAVSAGPAGVFVDSFSLRGAPLDRVRRAVPAPIDAARLEPLISQTVQQAVRSAPGPVRGCAISVAGPVDQETGRLVALPYAPFLLDEFAPHDVVASIIGSPIKIDNDVNWAALAEAHEGAGRDRRQFFLCYLGAGIGGAAVLDGKVLHGSRGLAGELAYVSTVGPAGRALKLVECFRTWGLLRPGSAAIDVDLVAEIMTGKTTETRRRRSGIIRAVAAALGTVAALYNADAILISGPWGTVPGAVELITEQFEVESSVQATIRPADLGDEAPLVGARIRAVEIARSQVIEDLINSS